MLQILQDYGILLLVGQFPDGPIGGLALTLFLAISGLLCSFPIAILVGVARTSQIKVIYYPVSALVHAIRGLPALLIIFWAYFIIPLVLGRTISGIATVICALVVYEIAFMESIPKGQVEAARSLGMSYFKTLHRVILPQALYQMIPSILNQFINLIKNTSLGYIISVNELTYSAYQVNSQLLIRPFEVYFLLALIYFLLCWSLGLLIFQIEKRIKIHRQISTRSI